MLQILKNALTGKVQKLNGRQDALEAVCAAAALVAAADGEISDKEVAATIKAIDSNAALQSAFRSQDIHRAAEQQLKRAEGGRVGRLGLKNEIKDIAGDHDVAEAVLLAALDVAESCGEGIDEKEQKVLDEIAGILGLKLSNYL